MAVAAALPPDVLRVMDRLLLAQQRILAPLPTLTVSAWCDRHRVLSRESSAEPGPWRTERTPYLQEPLDALGDPAVESVSCQFASQLGKSEVLLNAAAYFMAGDPSPILFVEPSIGEAENFSKIRIAPMIRDSPTLTRLVADPKARDSGNTLLVKEFPGGHITMVGANAPSGLASKPIRCLLFDEVDRAPASAGSEGDPVSLAERRTTTFWNRKLLKVSSPTITGISRIEQAYGEGSQADYCVPCPHCNAMQVIQWRDAEGRYRIVGERDASGKVIPGSTHYACVACGAAIEEKHKTPMLAAGGWVHAHPDRRRHRSFRLSSLYSPWRRWDEVLQDFLEAKPHPLRLRTFVNTILGETWDEQEGGRTPDDLKNRAEPWEGVVPDAPVVLTLGVDVQVDRLELVLVANGVNDEWWVCDWWQLPGDPQTPDPWIGLDAARAQAYPRGVTSVVRVAACAIDTGYMPDRCIDYALARRAQRVIPMRGIGGRGKPLVVNVGPEKYRRGSRQPWHLAGDTGKDQIAAALGVKPSPEPGAPQPGMVHFHDVLNPTYYDHLTAEAIVTRYTAGRPVREWALQPNRRNDALDATILARAAWAALGLPLQRALLARAQKAHARPEDGPEPPPPPPPPMPVAPTPRPKFPIAPRRRGGWVRGY